MTVDIHVSRSKNLILNGSRSTDDEYIISTTKNKQFKLRIILKYSINHFEKSHSHTYKDLFKTGAQGLARVNLTLPVPIHLDPRAIL